MERNLLNKNHKIESFFIDNNIKSHNNFNIIIFFYYRKSIMFKILLKSHFIIKCHLLNKKDYSI